MHGDTALPGNVQINKIIQGRDVPDPKVGMVLCHGFAKVKARVKAEPRLGMRSWLGKELIQAGRSKAIY